jgi:hypothetical protein
METRWHMSKREVLLHEIEGIPEPVVDQVLDFVQFLKARTITEKLDPALASESSLQKDWLRPEEDEAWQNL